MSSWYYLISQLPALPQDYNAPLPISEEYFMDLCSRFMDNGSLKILHELSLEPPRIVKKTGSFFVDSWYKWERSLRLALAEIRALRMKKEYSIEESFFPTDVLQTARTACGFESPLEAELFLNNARIDILTRLTPADSFSTDAVYSYCLKLKLSTRIKLFNEEAGLASYGKIYEKILEHSYKTN